jgi:hypothetical protein
MQESLEVEGDIFEEDPVRNFWMLSFESITSRENKILVTSVKF